MGGYGPKMRVRNCDDIARNKLNDIGFIRSLLARRWGSFVQLLTCTFQGCKDTEIRTRWISIQNKKRGRPIRLFEVKKYCFDCKHEFPLGYFSKKDIEKINHDKAN
jgi:hypothetical protein